MKKIEKFVNLTRKLSFGKTALNEAMSDGDKMLFAKCKADGGSDEYCKQEILRQKGEVDFDKYAKATLDQIDSEFSDVTGESPEDQFRTFLKNAGSEDSKYDLSTLNKIAKYVLPIGNEIAGGLAELPDEANFKISSDPRFNSILKKFIAKGLQTRSNLSSTDEFVDASSFFFDTASDIDGALVYSRSYGERDILLVNLDAMNEGDFEIFKKEFFNKIPHDKTGQPLTEKTSRIIKEAINYTNFYEPKKSNKRHYPYFSEHRIPMSEDLVRIMYFYKKFYYFDAVDLDSVAKGYELLRAFANKSYDGSTSNHWKQNKSKKNNKITILKSVPFESMPEPDELTDVITQVSDSSGWYEKNGYPTEIEIKLNYATLPEDIFDILSMLNYSRALTNVKFKIKSGAGGAQEGDRKPKEGATYNRLQNNILAYFEENPPYYDYNIGKHIFRENNIRESLKKFVKPRLITEDWSEVPTLFARAQVTGTEIVGWKNHALTLQDEVWVEKLKEEINVLIIRIQSHNYAGATVPMKDEHQAQREKENGSDWKKIVDKDSHKDQQSYINFLIQYKKKLVKEDGFIDALINDEDFWRFQTVYHDIRADLTLYIQKALKRDTEGKTNYGEWTDEAYDFIKSKVGDLIKLSELLAGGTGDPERVLARFPTFFDRYEVLNMMVDSKTRNDHRVSYIMNRFASVGADLDILQDALKQSAEQETDDVPEVKEQLQKKKRVKIKLRYKK